MHRSTATNNNKACYKRERERGGGIERGRDREREGVLTYVRK